jgi:hypothetical protein
LKNIGNIESVSVNYPNALEWLFLKRFQELFAHPQRPRDIHPSFFDTPVFGSCDGVSFSDITQIVPKISENGDRAPNLDSPTAQPSKWNKLLSLIDPLGRICLKPRDKSSSSEAYLITDAKFMGGRYKLTVGLCV